MERSSSPQPKIGERSALDERELVGGIVDRLQHDEQVADLAGAVDERRGLGAVGDAGGIERVLEVAERGAGRQQDAHVAATARLRVFGAVGVAANHRPSLAERALHDGRDVGGFALAELVGAGGVAVGHGAEQHDRGADRGGASHRFERHVLGL